MTSISTIAFVFVVGTQNLLPFSHSCLNGRDARQPPEPATLDRSRVASPAREDDATCRARR